MCGRSSVLTSRMFHKLSHVPRHSIQQWTQICINIFRPIINTVARHSNIFLRTAKDMCIKQSCFQGCQKEGKFKWQHFILSSDLITPVTDKEGSAQICRRKKLVKKSTLGGHCTTSGRSKRSKAGPCPRSSLSRTAAPHLTDKFEFFAVFDCSSVGRAWWLAPGRRPFQLR